MSKKRNKRPKPAPKGPKKPKAKRPYVLAKTDNGRTIQKLLAYKGMDPREYKDWVILTPGRMLEWMGGYNVSNTEGKPLALGPEAIALVHKRQLHSMLPKPMADQFWHTGLNRRVQRKGPGAPRTKA